MTTGHARHDVDAIVAQFPSHSRVDERVEPLRPGSTLRELIPYPRPLVLRGLASDWSASRTWTFDSLADKGAGITVSVTRSIIEQYKTVPPSYGPHWATPIYPSREFYTGRDKPQWFPRSPPLPRSVRF